jgi:SacI homology domain
MPGLVRKLIICASANGLIIQAHGSIEHHKAIQIDYRSRRIQDCRADEAAKHKSEIQLEAHGLIGTAPFAPVLVGALTVLGILYLASSSFLIAITRREQVAQIFGKPVYVVTDVAFLPLSSQQEASIAIKSATEARKTTESAPDSDLSDSDTEDYKQSTKAEDASSPTDDHQPLPKSESSTSIAQDVYAKRGQFGKFASQWLSRRGWGVGQAAGQPNTTANVSPSAGATAHGDATAAATPLKPEDAAAEMADQSASADPTQTSIDAMIPKILRNSRLILTSKSFFFSYDFDLTRRTSLWKGAVEAPLKSKLDPLVNYTLSVPPKDTRLTATVLLESQPS